MNMSPTSAHAAAYAQTASSRWWDDKGPQQSSPSPWKHIHGTVTLPSCGRTLREASMYSARRQHHGLPRG